MWVLKLITLCQGMFIVGISIIIFILHFTLKEIDRQIKRHIFFVSVGFLCVLTCTIITVFREVYHPNDFWYWILGIGYLLIDISLIILFRLLLRKYYEKH